jgi:hypothetical protein
MCFARLHDELRVEVVQERGSAWLAGVMPTTTMAAPL